MRQIFVPREEPVKLYACIQDDDSSQRYLYKQGEDKLPPYKFTVSFLSVAARTAVRASFPCTSDASLMLYIFSALKGQYGSAQSHVGI